MVVVAVTSSAADKGRSVNRSCIQCRERKIKCDRLAPCSQCTSKGAGDECKRELRKKRAKNKRPFPKRKSRNAPATSSTSTAVTSTTALPYNVRSGLDAAAPMTSWAERPMTSASRQSQSDTSHTPSSSGKAVTPNTSSSTHEFSYFSAQNKERAHNARAQTSSSPNDEAASDTDDESYSDSDESDNDDDTLQPDDRLQMLEANQLMQLHSAPQFRCPFALKDVYAEWRAMPMDARRALLREIRDALPSHAQTLHLVHDVYAKRYHSLHGNIVHIPSVQVVLTELRFDPVFEQRERYAFGHITTALMVVFSALRVAPLDRFSTWARRGSTNSQIEPLSQKEIRQSQRKIYALVKRFMRFESTFTLGSVSELQTACLILACGKGSSAFLDSLADCAIRSAMRMRVHRLGTLEKLHSPEARTTQVVTGEMAIRCWWALVRRDWSQSNKNRSYRISPSQFNTRQPLNLFDDELLTIPCPRSHLRSTWTHVSHSLATIDFAIMTRTLVDQVNSQSDLDNGPETFAGWGLASVFGQRLSPTQRDSLDVMFQSIISAFPAHYSLEARYDVIQLVDVERWLLHQRLFYLFLTLHMPLVSEATRPHGSLMYMASHILDIHDKVRDLSEQLDNCVMSILQTLRACLVLLLDLFFTDPAVNVSGLSRLMTRRKITAALEKLPMESLSSTTKLCVQLVQLLVSIEDQHHRAQFGSGGLSGNEGAAVDATAETAALRNRWHATCQILDVLLNDGYWKSFRKNLLQLDHLIPDWLQEPLREAANENAPRASPSTSKAASSDAASVTPQSAAASLMPPPEPVYASRIERAFDAGTTDALLGAGSDVDLNMPFDPKLLEDFDVSGLDLPGSSSQLPHFDMDLIGHQDFEGFGNSSQSLDFAKMLMDWRVEVPLSFS